MVKNLCCILTENLLQLLSQKIKTDFISNVTLWISLDADACIAAYILDYVFSYKFNLNVSKVFVADYKEFELIYSKAKHESDIYFLIGFGNRCFIFDFIVDSSIPIWILDAVFPINNRYLTLEAPQITFLIDRICYLSVLNQFSNIDQDQIDSSTKKNFDLPVGSICDFDCKYGERVCYVLSYSLITCLHKFDFLQNDTIYLVSAALASRMLCKEIASNYYNFACDNLSKLLSFKKNLNNDSSSGIQNENNVTYNSKSLYLLFPTINSLSFSVFSSILTFCNHIPYEKSEQDEFLAKIKTMLSITFDEFDKPFVKKDTQYGIRIWKSFIQVFNVLAKSDKSRNANNQSDKVEAKHFISMFSYSASCSTLQINNFEFSLLINTVLSHKSSVCKGITVSELQLSDMCYTNLMGYKLFEVLESLLSAEKKSLYFTKLVEATSKNVVDCCNLVSKCMVLRKAGRCSGIKNQFEYFELPSPINTYSKYWLTLVACTLHRLLISKKQKTLIFVSSQAPKDEVCLLGYRSMSSAFEFNESGFVFNKVLTDCQFTQCGFRDNYIYINKNDSSKVINRLLYKLANGLQAIEPEEKRKKTHTRIY